MTHKRADCNTSRVQKVNLFFTLTYGNRRRRRAKNQKIRNGNKRKNENVRRERARKRIQPSLGQRGTPKQAPSESASDHHHYHLKPPPPPTHVQRGGKGESRGWRGRRRRASQPIKDVMWTLLRVWADDILRHRADVI